MIHNKIVPFLIVCFLALFLVFGCNSPTEILQTTVLSPSPHETQNEVPKPTTTLTTIWQTTPSTTLELATPTITITPYPESIIEQRCIQVETNLRTDIPGSVVISINQSGQSNYILNLSTQQRVEFKASIDIVISPDFSKFLYSVPRSDMIVVTDSMLNILWQLNNTEHEFGVVGWLDNTHFLLGKFSKDDSPSLPTLISYDLTTNEQIEWDLQLPDMNETLNEVRWKNLAHIIPHPSFDYVIYPRLSGVPSPFDQKLIAADSIVLWNTDQKKIVTEIFDGSRIFQPLWSPDGNSFITIAPPYVTDGQVFTNTSDLVANAPQILQVDLTGRVTSLTNIPTGEYSAINYFQWSPDGRQIAFGHLTEGGPPDVPGRLSILNLSSGIITDYCMAGIPQWSPDGQYILLTHLNEQAIDEVYLVNIETAKAWLLAENASGLGWMTLP